MDILEDMGVSKLSAKVFFKVDYSFKWPIKKYQYNSSIAVKSCLCLVQDSK